jgi:DNA-directed RNA polymerase specialized sigma24 family protein
MVVSVPLLMRLEEDFEARRRSGQLESAFPRWLARGNGLGRFDRLEDLIAACRDPRDCSWEAKDTALAALCVEAATGDEDAASVLLWLLLPGLLRERERIAGPGLLPPDELDAELLAGIWEGAAQLQPGARHVARTLLNRARWTALDAVRHALDWTVRAAPLPPDLEEDPALPGAEPEQVIVSAVREGALSPQEAELVMASRRTVREMSMRLGISLPAAQKRRHRARERLHAWLSRSSRESPANLRRRSSREPPAETG